MNEIIEDGKIPETAKEEGKKWGRTQTFRKPFVPGDFGLYMNDAYKEGARIALFRTNLRGTQIGHMKYIEFFFIGAIAEWESRALKTIL
jgi:hypothetical protein